ncbi:hypothetical protein N7478_005514 [Penicillium angulare]|uniref:uncharacterized protein n=1 Tax=Penicillium angulare TaxID=116970 RepID=UPI002540B18F|nr:uncharacterized protein N7478_005514 [Penicillium angulare]KAJ5280142.1 hypothetical protein N7478_005514 [Penicillium angulare]
MLRLLILLCTALGYGQQDYGPRLPATAPPSRPPSRVNMTDTTQSSGNDSMATNVSGSSGKPAAGQGLSLAEREEQELQQAVAMSLHQGMGTQETGVTAAAPSQAHFGKATRDNYEEGAWAMTLFNETAQEVLISPDPEDRKRIGEEPVFIRPTQNNLYLGGFLTIIHEIPLAREALLLRKKLLFDYGNDKHWWNGQSINLPKIVTIHEGSDDSDWEDPIYETQRLMAFLDSTKRAFGSSDALTNMRQMYATSSDSEEAVARFLETWHSAAIRADPDNPLSMAFMSHAYKRELMEEDNEEPVSRELFVFEPVVDQGHGQTLYDVLDSAIWSDRPGENLDDVWLEHVGEILVMKLDSPENVQSVDVEIPAVFYPDRYLSTCQHLAREMRLKKLEAQQAVMRIEQLIYHYKTPPNPVGTLSRSEVLEKAASATPVALKTALDGNSKSMTPEVAKEKAERITQQLRALATKIEEKVKALEVEKQKALETMRTYSKMLTEPSESPHGPPSHKYTLRGVCTKPHVTYLLKNRETKDRGDGMDVDGEKQDDSQWWRISFSTEDGKTRRAEKIEAQGDKTATQSGDVVGYTARKVSEIEVLKAAREEGRSVLLVYASDAAMDSTVNPAPPQLQGFVNKDNEVFAVECDQALTEADNDNSSGLLLNRTGSEKQPRPHRQDQDVNVFDYEVPGFDSEEAGQEMQEKKRSSLLTTTGPGSAAQPPLYRPVDDNDDSWDHAPSDDEMVDHVEHAPAQ